MTRIEKLSEQFGVPMPETCKTLGWQSESVFYWCYLGHPFGCNAYLCMKKPSGYFIIDDDNPRLLEITILEKLKVYTAPQFHEMQKALGDTKPLGKKLYRAKNPAEFLAKFIIHNHKHETL